MKPLKIIFSIFLLIILINGSVYSQAKFSLGPTVGLTVPSGDYSGTTLEYYSGQKYGLSSGFNLGLIVKAGIGPINLRASGIYSSLSNTGNATPDKPNSFVEVKHNLLMFSAGPEFAFKLPASPIKPYGGVDLLFTSISGDVDFRGVKGVPSDPNDGKYDMGTATRIGIGFGAGVEYNFGKKYALDLGIRFNLINLLGKKFEDLPSDERIDSYLNLNDDSDPSYDPTDPDKKHPIGSSRSISTIQFNLAFLFGL